jgi:hypothetical protein
MQTGEVCVGTNDPVGYDINVTDRPDRIDRLKGHDFIWGLESGDYINGGPDNDEIAGDYPRCNGAGNDTLIGGPDNKDILSGGPGNGHECYGEGGTDRFYGCEYEVP